MGFITVGGNGLCDIQWDEARDDGPLIQVRNVLLMWLASATSIEACSWVISSTSG
jgi:hypothetical protein